jgi:hypothetical protein
VDEVAPSIDISYGEYTTATQSFDQVGNDMRIAVARPVYIKDPYSRRPSAGPPCRPFGYQSFTEQFAGPIDARRRGRVVFGQWMLRRRIYVRRRREQNEIYWCLIGGCQHVAQAADVHIHGHVRLGFAMWNDLHCRQMHDCRGLRLPGYLDDIGRICNVRTGEPNEITTQAAGDAIEAMLISIDSDYLVTFPDQGIEVFSATFS